jgi:hypothetical protein
MVLLLGVVLVLSVAAGVAWFFLAPAMAASGDPQGRRLKQLQQTADAIPSNVHVLYRHDLEPHQDSCDGRPETRGWGDVVVQVHFSSAQSATSVADRADQLLSGRGWARVIAFNDTDGTESVWRKNLDDGSPATVLLSKSQFASDEWTLYASAPPVGKAASGC